MTHIFLGITKESHEQKLRMRKVHCSEQWAELLRKTMKSVLYELI